MPDNSICYLHPVGLRCYDEYADKQDEAAWEYSSNPKWKIPVSMKNNLYLNNAVPTSHEAEAKVYLEKGIDVQVFVEKGKVKICIENPQILQSTDATVVTSEQLGKSYHAEMAFEQPDGTNYRFDEDFFGKVSATDNVVPGPFAVEGEEKVEFILG